MLNQNPALSEIINSHDYKTTYIVGDVISNGCQTFFSKDIHKICLDYSVDEHHINKALLELSKVSKDPVHISKLSNHAISNVRRSVALQGLCHEQLMFDVDPLVRCYVAESCNEEIAKILLTDTGWRVRAAIAKREIGLDVLINDQDQDVLLTVALTGKYNHKLFNHRSSQIRAAVALTGYKSEEMINDPSFLVRANIAKLGLHLDVLINDHNPYVLEEVIKHQYKINEIYEKHKHNCNIVEHLIRYTDIDVYQFLKHPNPNVRKEIASRGQHLDILVDDPSWLVRYYVAKQGYGLEKLLNDPDSDVRERACKSAQSNTL